MSDKTPQIHIRLPVDLISRLDNYADRIRQKGLISFSRTDAVRVLLDKALSKRGRR